MDQLISIWNGLDSRRRVVLVLAILAVVVTLSTMARLVNQPTMALLYSGLEPEAAGQVVTALEQRGVAHEVRGTAIYVAADNRDALRLSLAAEGLPALSGQGYELLDSLTGFGTTAQMFDAAYWRAKEGELARTIQSAANVRSARVHIASAAAQPFRATPAASASVTAIMTAGQVTPANAQAMRHLVASAVAGLSPQDVSVIDGRSGLVVPLVDDAGGAGSAAERAAELKRNIERLLEARVGPGNVAVEVSVETVTEREAITERRFDPEGRVAISSETEETSSSSTDSGPDAVTVASNLPEGDAGGGGRSASSQDSQTREIVNYEVSETRREVLRTPGAVRRITAAVLVNGIMTTDPETGAVSWAPRDAAELETLRALVASAIGLDESRGDVLTLSTMELARPPQPEAPPAPGLIERLNLDMMRLIQLGVLALVSLVVALFVLRPLLARRPEGAAQSPALAAPAAPAPGLPGPAAEGAGPGADAPPTAPGELPQMPMAQVDIPPLGAAPVGPAAAAPADRLRELLESRKDESIEILRSWMQDEAESA